MKAEILLDKIKEVFTERNTDLSKTRFTCFDGTNAMNGTKLVCNLDSRIRLHIQYM